MIVLDNPTKKYWKRYNVEVNGVKILYTGEWRKDIAIGYSEASRNHDVPNLVSRDKKILYRGDVNREGYVDEIYRTSAGYYLVYSWRDWSAPGKDSDYRKSLKCIISEDGQTKIDPSRIDSPLPSMYTDTESTWIDKNGSEVFIPREVGMGIVEYENSFYRLDDFKKIFDIPQKFHLENIFEKGFCRFSVPEDNRDFIVTVKKNEIVDWVETNNVEGLVQLIEKTSDTSLIKYCKKNDSSIISVIKKQQKSLIEQEQIAKENRLSKVIFYSVGGYPFYGQNNSISDTMVTAEDFLQGITFSPDELEIIKELHQTICKEGGYFRERLYRCRIRKTKDDPTRSLESMFYKDFILLRYDYNGFGNYMYRFYSIDGACLSDEWYLNLRSTKPNTPVEDDKNFDNHCFRYSSGIIVVQDGKLFDNQFPAFMYNEDRRDYEDISVKENFIRYGDERYDFFFNKIDINYVDLNIEEEIKKYLFRMEPDFHCFSLDWGKEHDKLSYGPGLVEDNYKDGSIYLPKPGVFDNIYYELHYRNKNTPNFINKISIIGNYTDEEGQHYKLYLFECRPNAYCDTKGHIIYDFNPDNIVL